ncbi:MULTISPECIES: ferric reductase-like transmembrane domain-containing protein [unclassified Streptomyces]|uniref:ferric reductase-like transmembrane domain-containing protein n=1 Tax=unclassified Streptomyces TaxID=2593676 RepID=UPI0033B1BCA0
MNPRRNNSSLPRVGRSAYGAATAVVLVLIPVIVLVGGSAVQDFLNFGAGVLSLVSLSCSVIWGLVATDRIFLDTRQRLVAQAVHRTTAVSSVAFLLLHITVKIALDHTSLLSALIPFSLGFTGIAGLIGLGSLAGLLMIFTAVTGALRSAFASPAPVAARWRAMHQLAYPAWCAALVHGLYAGRAAKPVFTILYSLCLLAVMGALALRTSPAPFKHKVAARVLALIGGGNARGFREDLDASRAAAMESPQPGSAGRSAQRSSGGDGVPSQRKESSSPLFGGAPDPAETAGFAAAYRTVAPSGGSPAAPGTQQFQMPVNAQPTETFPRVGNGGAQTSWPVPTGGPVGEAPASAYDPLNDTGYTAPVYGNPPAGGYGTSDVYNTGETNASYRTYNTNDTYDSGPTTDVLPGAFDAPGSGESWNAPSGGFK